MLPIRSAGTEIVSGVGIASIGAPAATVPRSGICVAALPERFSLEADGVYARG